MAEGAEYQSRELNYIFCRPLFTSLAYLLRVLARISRINFEQFAAQLCSGSPNRNLGLNVVILG
jgi:hypothetical protein